MHEAVSDRNNLFPVFLKLEELDTLIVGGGNVGLEKLSGLLKSSPGARIKMVSKAFLPEVRELASAHPSVQLIERGFRSKDLLHKDLVILATDDHLLHEKVQKLTREKRILLNVADTPRLCDFYLGAVVTKGNLKLGISTNGKSPTIAKRLREFFEYIIPEDIDHLLLNMTSVREKIKGDFRLKVDKLNEVTSSWLRDH